MKSLVKTFADFVEVYPIEPHSRHEIFRQLPFVLPLQHDAHIERTDLGVPARVWGRVIGVMGYSRQIVVEVT